VPPLRETSDGGVTWHDRRLGFGATDLFGVQFDDAQRGWVWGVDRGGGVVYATTDTGETWQRHSLPRDVAPASLDFVTDDEGWVGALGDRNRVILHTTDGGQTWQRQSTPKGFRFTVVFDIDFVDAQHGWAVGVGVIPEYLFNVLWKTSDGGASWQMARLWWPEWALITRCDFDDAQHGRVFGEGVWRTENGGVDWTREIAGFETLDVARNASGGVWTVGPDGMLATVDGADADAIPPATIADADEAWHRPPYELSFSAADYGGGPVDRIEYRLDDERAWSVVPGDRLVFDPPPGDRSLEGSHRLFYRSVDAAGNVEPAHLTTVRIDTTCPVIPKLRRLVVRGWTAFGFRVYDVKGARGTAVIRIRREALRRTPAHEVAVIRGVRWYSGYGWTWRRLHLAAGRYSYSIRATDAAGNGQQTATRGELIVLPPLSPAEAARRARQAAAAGTPVPIVL